MANLLIPVSIGELIDKITILEIKQEKVIDVSKLNNITNEYNLLKQIVLVHNIDMNSKELSSLVEHLKFANEQIWNAENILRNLISDDNYNSVFIEAAKTAHTYNAQRYECKQKINQHLNSPILEEKQYG